MKRNLFVFIILLFVKIYYCQEYANKSDTTEASEMGLDYEYANKSDTTEASEIDLDYDTLLDRLNNYLNVTQTESPDILQEEQQKHNLFNDTQTAIPENEIEIAQPNFKIDSPYQGCGYISELQAMQQVGYFHGESTEPFFPLYYLNKTAKELSSQGFKIKVNSMYFSFDVLKNFTYYNDTYENTVAFSHIGSQPGVSRGAVGGKAAPVARSFYMAQIGEIKGYQIEWLCDGVILNKRWILSAAHCFIFPGIKPNVVRLGAQNLTDDIDVNQLWNPPIVRDYPIILLVPHPDFKFTERYHDLVLIQIPEDKYYYDNIKPICLPWGPDSNKDVAGKEVALTGWGALQFGGRKTKILQEVMLKVFNTSVCHKAYTDPSIPKVKEKYPQGLYSDQILCAGWEEGGRDACGGDSGAPIVYTKDYHYILAGIVSGGYGCGLKEYPGLYIPINRPKYLQWIKDVAFKEYL